MFIQSSNHEENKKILMNQAKIILIIDIGDGRVSWPLLHLVNQLKSIPRSFRSLELSTVSEYWLELRECWLRLSEAG